MGPKPERTNAGRFLHALALTLLAAALATFVVLVRQHWPFTIDDSFITFRYSQNLAAGSGPVYNPGERAEGYTSFTWMLLMALPHLFGADAVHWSKAFGILAGLGLAGVVFFYTVRLIRPRLESHPVLGGALAVFVLLTSPAFATHVVSGMETVLFTLLITWFFGAATSLATERRGRAMPLAVLGLLTTLTRPEGAVAVGVVLAGLLLRLESPNRQALCKSFLFAFLIPAALYWVWRWWYYGLLFPLAFYVKLGFDSGASGVQDVMNFLRHVGPRLGPFVLLGSVAIGKCGLPALGAIIVLVVFFLFPKHWMGYEWRYLFPIYAWLVILAVTGLAAGVHWLLSRSPRAPRRRAVIEVSTAAIYLAGPFWIGTGLWPRHDGDLEFKLSYATFLAQRYIPLARSLEGIPEGPRPRLLAITDAGTVPYYSKWQTIDLVGLNDAVIGRSGQHDPSYVLSRDPDLIFLNSFDFKTFSGRGAWVQDLYEACVEDGYEKLHCLSFRPDYHVWIIGKPSEPAAAHFVSGLQPPSGGASP